MKLKIHNYGIIEDLEIALSPGLTTLSGQNGSGKSTTVDALFFALTGEPMDGRNVSELVNWEALDGKAVVTLSCADFTVTRTIKSGLTHKLELPDGMVLTKKADVNSWIFDRYKIDNPGVLKEVFFSAQLHATDLFDTTNSNRLAMLSKLFGLDQLEHCRDVIYRILSETPVPVINEELISQLIERVDAAFKAVDTAGAEKTVAEEAVKANDFDANEYLRVRSAPTDIDLSTHKQALTAAQEAVRTATDRYSELSGKIENCRKYRGLHDEYVKRRQVTDYQTRIQELSEGVSREKLLEAQKNIYQESAILEKEIAELRKRSGDTDTCPLTNGTPCIEYLRLHDPQLIGAEIEAKQKRFDEIKADLEQVTVLVDDANERWQKQALLKGELAKIELGPDPDVLEEEVDRELESFGDLDTMINEWRSLEEYLNIWEGEVAKHSAWLAEHASDTAVSAADKQFWEDKKHEHDCLALKLKAAEATYIDKLSALKKDEAMLAQMQCDKERSLKQRQRIETLKDVRDLLSRDNLQRALMQRALKRVNKEITTCSRIFNFKYRVFLTETGDIVFQDDNIDPKDVRFLSGGQKYTAAIITRIAFARVLNTKFEFMVLDEPSICLDDNSREMLAELLNALNARFRGEGKYLVVPTHDELILAQGNDFNVKGN